MKKKLLATAVGTIIIVQSSASLAQADPVTWTGNTPKFGLQVGLCSPVVNWHWLNWLPCVGI